MLIFKKARPYQEGLIQQKEQIKNQLWEEYRQSHNCNVLDGRQIEWGKEKLWYRHCMDTDMRDSYLITGDDLDSWLTTNFYHKKYGIPIGGYVCPSEEILICDHQLREHNYDYYKGIDRVKPFFMDYDVGFNQYAVANHVRMQDNLRDFNLCRTININPSDSPYEIFKAYTSKTLASSYFTALCYEGIDMNAMEEKDIILMLLVDSHYTQFYNKDFRRVWDEWIKFWGYHKLTEVLSRYKKSELDKVHRCFKMREKIKVNNEGYLITNIDWQRTNSVFGTNLHLPEYPFLYQPLKIQSSETNLRRMEQELFSHAVTNTTTIKFSETDLKAIDGALDIITYDKNSLITDVDFNTYDVDFDTFPNCY